MFIQLVKFLLNLDRGAREVLPAAWPFWPRKNSETPETLETPETPETLYPDLFTQLSRAGFNGSGRFGPVLAAQNSGTYETPETPETPETLETLETHETL
jgi:hypothetical protein